MSLLKQAGIDVHMAALFNHPTIERLAAYIESETYPVPAPPLPVRTTKNNTANH